MLLESDDKIQKLLASNDPNSYKDLLFLVDFGRYFELVKNGEKVMVCEHCLHALTEDEINPLTKCFNKEELLDHSWKEFIDHDELQNYIKENISNHYVRN